MGKAISKNNYIIKRCKVCRAKKILESNGYEGRKPGSGSSHWTFRKQGKPPVTIPENEPIKLVYVKLIKDIIESEEE